MAKDPGEAAHVPIQAQGVGVGADALEEGTGQAGHSMRRTHRQQADDDRQPDSFNK